MTIYGAKSSCKCIRTEILAKKLAPGASTDLYIHFDANGYFDEVEKPVTIYTSDPTQPAYGITVKGKFFPRPGEKPAPIE
jgi:hypothetical protein